jgi:hypothetical protein
MEEQVPPSRVQTLHQAMTKRASSKVSAFFIEPMLCLSTGSLPEGKGWEYELFSTKVVKIRLGPCFCWRNVCGVAK